MIQLDFLAVLAHWPALLKGAAFTLGLSAVAAVLGVGLGVKLSPEVARSRRRAAWR